MDIVRFSITKPVTVIVGVIFVVLFGLIGLHRMPYQLSPTVVAPDITVKTSWRGATPYEIEREIIERQEDTLKGIPGLLEMESDSYNGRGRITLRFSIGTDVDDALLRVSNKINEVRGYPDGADRPVISATGSATSPVVWMVMKTIEGNPRPVETYHNFFHDEVRQHLERIEGVADLVVHGGTRKEMQVTVRPDRLAAFGLTIKDIINALKAENANISAGGLDMGRRNYRISTTGEFKSVEEIESVVLKSSGQRRVFLREVAVVERGYAKKRSTVLHNGEKAVMVGVQPEPGANVLEMTDRVKETVDRLNEVKLRPHGVRLEWVYDQRFYIRGAIKLVKGNIFVGGLLAVAVLLLFLRSIRSTFVVMLAIPISIIGTFIFMDAFGRNLNVVSLAGIAFAVGMLADSAIVVVENIDRHRRMGRGAFEAAYEGTREVWGAIIASTLTTVAVFLPVVFIEEEAGQLFRDIALAVVSAIMLSLFVSISVIPMLSGKLMALPGGRTVPGGEAVLKAGRKMAGTLMELVSLAIGSRSSRSITVASLTALALLTTWLLMPRMEYLPKGNRNFVLTRFSPPPGLSSKEIRETGESFFDIIAPYMGKDHDGVPGIKDIFFAGGETFMLSGARSIHWDRAKELVPLFMRTIYLLPGMSGVSMQAGIFQGRRSGGRTIELDISGDEMDDILRVAETMYDRIRASIPRVRSVPSIEMLYPEVRIVPDRDRLRANDMSSTDLGVALDVLLDGRDIGEFKEEGKKKVDLVLKIPEEGIRTPEDLSAALVVTPRGAVVPVSSLSRSERTEGVTRIRHLERMRTITLQVTPPEELPLQSAMEDIEGDIIRPMREAGMLRDVQIKMSGAAGKLTETRRVLQWNFLLAAVIAYLLMSALFGNFIYPLIIMFTVPLAGAGGVMGLWLLNLFVYHPMDILTMLGFIILVGVVVNNAILIVHQSLNNLRMGGMEHRPAVLHAVRSRLRPMYMSALTSIFGMLPLVIFPGAGSEIYRGIGSVILGGIAVSTVFTVFVIPSLLIFAIRLEKTVGDSGGEAEA